MVSAMKSTIQAAAAALAVSLWANACQAAVTLKFELLESYSHPQTEGYTGGFEVTLPRALGEEDITNAMTSCRQERFGQAVACANTFLMRDWLGRDVVSFRQHLYFTPGAFNTAGVYESISLGPNARARGRLTVSGVAAPAPKVSVVPEPATWALLIVGAGLAGLQLRLRHQYGAPVFQSPSGPIAPL